MSAKSEVLVLLLDLNSKGMVRIRGKQTSREDMLIEDIIDYAISQMSVFVLQNNKNRFFLLTYDENSVDLVFPRSAQDKLLLETLALGDARNAILERCLERLISRTPCNTDNTYIIEALYHAIAGPVTSDQQTRC